METKVVALRRRGRRARRRALVVAGAGAAVGAVALGAFLVYRLTRPTTARERLRRLVPSGLTNLRGNLPPLRLYIGERQVGEEPKAPRWEGVAIRVAQAAGTAAAGALASRLLATLAERNDVGARLASPAGPSGPGPDGG
jgi:hypothetical protein